MVLWTTYSILKTLDEHVSHISILLNKLKQANLVINHEKYKFMKSSIKFLGHIISADGICTDLEKINAISNFTKLKHAKDIRAFLGLTGYYTRFNPTYSNIVAPLLDLLKKGVKWRWQPHHQQALQTVKELYLTNLQLYHPSNKGAYVLYTDTSDIAIEVVLYQHDGKGEHWPIAFV